MPLCVAQKPFQDCLLLMLQPCELHSAHLLDCLKMASLAVHKLFASVWCADIVPTYTLGASQLLTFKGPVWLSRKLQTSIGIFWGWRGSPIPRPHPLITLVSKPIPRCACLAFCTGCRLDDIDCANGACHWLHATGCSLQ